MADAFPLFLPIAAKRLFQGESLLRRIALTARWTEASQLLEIYGSLGGLALKEFLSCGLSVAEPQPAVVQFLSEKAQAIGAGERLVLRHMDPKDLDFSPGIFDGILSFGRIVGPVEELLRKWRPLLALHGRAGITLLARVGRQQGGPLVEYWNRRLGTAVPSIREALGVLENEGFEPELVDCIGGSDLDAYYDEVEALLTDCECSDSEMSQIREEIAVHRLHAANSNVAFAFAVARRKEPGEVPPASRDGG